MRTKTLKKRSRIAKFTLDLKDQSRRKITYQLKGLCGRRGNLLESRNDTEEKLNKLVKEI